MAGVLDGVSLNHLEPGLTYEVEESLGAYLASTESAIEVPFDDSPVMGSKDEALIEASRAAQDFIMMSRGSRICRTLCPRRCWSHGEGT